MNVPFIQNPLAINGHLGSSQPPGCPEVQSYHMLGIESWKYLANDIHDSSKSKRGKDFPESKSGKGWGLGPGT